MNLRAVRVLRTEHSERHLILEAKSEVAAVDLHYLSDGRVAGTVTVFEGQSINENNINLLLAFIDEDLLPEVSLKDDSLSFTVVIGKVLGNFLRDTDSPKV